MSDAGCGDPRCGADYCRGSQVKAKNDSALTLRDRIAATLAGAIADYLSYADAYTMADAVIAEWGLVRQWRADFGYDGYSKCATRDEATELVDDFNSALGDDVEDGEQAMVMHRWVTDWRADDE